MFSSQPSVLPRGTSLFLRRPFPCSSAPHCAWQSASSTQATTYTALSSKLHDILAFDQLHKIKRSDSNLCCDDDAVSALHLLEHKDSEVEVVDELVDLLAPGLERGEGGVGGVAAPVAVHQFHRVLCTRQRLAVVYPAVQCSTGYVTKLISRRLPAALLTRWRFGQFTLNLLNKLNE